MEDSSSTVNIEEDIYARKNKRHNTDEERELAKKLSMQKYYINNKEMLIEKSRRYKIDMKIKNGEKQLPVNNEEEIYARKYKKHNTDEERELSKKISIRNYYLKNKEKILEHNRRYKIDMKIKMKNENENK